MAADLAQGEGPHAGSLATGLLRWLKRLPPALRETLYYRCFYAHSARYPSLFEEARVHIGSGFVMRGLIPGDLISGSIAFTGFYELGFTRALQAEAVAGGLLVDVGANLGYFSLLWASMSVSGTVLAFEAAPGVADMLRRNVKANEFDNRVRVIESAVSAEDGDVAFDLGPLEQTGWGGIADGSESDSLRVPCIRLDTALGDREIDVLKVDVEGADALVLEGAEGLLSRGLIKKVFFEQNPKRMQGLGIEPDRAFRLLERVGYVWHRLGSNDRDWVAVPATLAR